MNQEIKQKWINALNSGEYKQGRDALHIIKTDRFCCLGVLCELAKQENIVTRLDDNLFSYYKDDNEKNDLELPSPVMEWAEINDSVGKYKETNLSLAELNDRGKSFKYIANIIEKHF